MFNELIESTLSKKKTNKNWTVVFSTVVQMLMLGVLILIPLIYTEALPKAMLSILLVAPPTPPAPPPAQQVRTTLAHNRPLIRDVFVEPSAIPHKVVVLTEPEPAPEVVDNSASSNIFGNIPGQGIVANSGPAAPPAPKVPIPNRIKQGGTITAALLISQTRPAYPALAIQARIQGNVILHAIIDRGGNVVQLEVLSGHPLLVKAATDAVKQWRYKPTLLNDVPVEVDTTITVTFTLGG